MSSHIYNSTYYWASKTSSYRAESLEPGPGPWTCKYWTLDWDFLRYRPKNTQNVLQIISLWTTYPGPRKLGCPGPNVMWPISSKVPTWTAGIYGRYIQVRNLESKRVRSSKVPTLGILGSYMTFGPGHPNFVGPGYVDLGIPRVDPQGRPFDLMGHKLFQPFWTVPFLVWLCHVRTSCTSLVNWTVKKSYITS